MSIDFVLTLTETDCIGLVEDFTCKVLELNGSVEAGRMAPLEGFATLMLTLMPAESQRPRVQAGRAG